MYNLPHDENLPEVEVTAITMRGDRPIYRNHQTTPATDHQPLPRLCHEAVLYNRLSEIGLDVKDVRFPTWGAALSCILQFGYPRDGMVNDALMLAMARPGSTPSSWSRSRPTPISTIPPTSITPSRRDAIPRATSSWCRIPAARRYDPSAAAARRHYPWRVVGKMASMPTIKSRHDPADFERAWPRNWGKVKLPDYL